MNRTDLFVASSLRQADVAARVGCNQATISRYLRDRYCSPTMAARIDEVLRVAVDDRRRCESEVEQQLTAGALTLAAIGL